MKSEIIEAAPVPEKSKYPYLGKVDKESGVIVLFTSEKTGTIVFKGTHIFDIGFTCSDWVEESFTPFTGTVQLSND